MKPQAVNKGRFSRFKPYPKYKDSGMEWLGEIPECWEVRRIKFVSHLIAGQSPSSETVCEGLKGLPFLQGNAEFHSLYPAPRLSCNTATTIDVIYSETMKAVRVPLPPLREQDAIVEFVHNEISKTDLLIRKVYDGIERLKEYRTALISTAVTGKIDVRDPGRATTGGRPYEGTIPGQQ